MWGIDAEKAFLPPLKLTQRRGDGGRPVGAADGPLRRQVRPGPRRRLREARARPAVAARRARRTDARRPVEGAARRAVQRQRPAPDEGLGRTAGRDHRLRAGATTRAAPRRAGRPSGRTSSSRRSRPTRCISSGFDEERGALRTFKIERIRIGRADAADVRAARRRRRRPRRCGRPGTSSRTSRRSRSSCASRRTSRAASCEATWHPTQTVEDRGRRLAPLAGDGVGHDRDPPLDPVVGRRRRGPRAGGAAATTWPTRTGGRSAGTPRASSAPGRDVVTRATRSPRSTSSATRSTATSS